MLSKLWPHCQLPDKSRDFVWDKMKPGGALVMTPDANFFDKASGIIIARKHYPAEVQAERVFRSPLISTANQTVDEILNEYRNVDHKVTIYEAFNEVEEFPGRPLTGDRLKIYAEWGGYCAEAFHRSGKRYLFGSFSVGQPIDIEGDWLILQEAVKGADALSVHEYGAPTIQDGYGKWWTLRYRRVLERLRRLGVTPYVIITELGIDRGLLGEKLTGWRGRDDQNVTPVADFVRQLAEYDRELQKDPQVLGATIFTCGGNADWTTFDINNEDAIADYIGNNTTGPAVWPGGVLPLPRPAPAPEGDKVIIGAGLMKAESVVGPYLESEVYHFPGTDREVSLAVGENGYATWSRKTNETVAHTNTGEVYRDYGNWRQGRLVRVSGL